MADCIEINFFFSSLQCSGRRLGLGKVLAAIQSGTQLITITWLCEICICFLGQPVLPLCYVSCSVVSDSLRLHGLQSTRLLCPWYFPGKNSGVGCPFLLQVVFPTQGSNPRFLHCRWILYQLSHQGSPRNPWKSSKISAYQDWGGTQWGIISWFGSFYSPKNYFVVEVTLNVSKVHLWKFYPVLFF